MNKDHRLKEITSEATDFKREIGVFGGVSIIGGIMIGSGIFYLGAIVLQRTGMSLGLSLACWLVGGIISLMGGLCFAELGAAMPRSGGSTVYLSEAFHPVVGFIRGFSDWAIGGPGSVAAISIALPSALQSFFSLGEGTIKVIAIALIVVLTVYNLFGIRVGTLLQDTFMIAKLIPIFLIMFAALIAGKVSPDLSLTPVVGGPVGTVKILSMVAFGVVASLWAYEGWSNINSVAEEMKDPRKSLPRAVFLGIGFVTLLYVVFNYAIYRVLPFEEIRSMLSEDNLYLGTAVAKKIFGNFGAVLVTIGMAVSMFGALNGLIIAQPRMYYALAQEGHFFKSFARLHPKHKVPTAALLVQGLLSILLVLSRNLDQLTSLVVFIGMVFNLMTILAVFILRRKYPHIARPYKVFGYPFTVFVTSLIFFGLVVNTFFDDPTSALLGITVPVVGVFVYMYFDRRLKRERRAEGGA